MNGVLASTWHVLEQTPPPTLREILGAYNSGGDGDRDMLLAMLNAKSAEDQRLASLAALQRTMLQVYQSTPPQHQHPHLDPSTYYTPPTFSHSDSKLPRYSQQHSSSSRSPRLPSIREAPPPLQPPRKRHRTSHSSSSSHSTTHDSCSNPSHDQLPPSPYSSTSSDSPDYSPRSRASMAIGSLLSSGPSRDPTADDPQAPSDRRACDRDHLPPPQPAL